MKGHTVVYSTKILGYHNYRRQNINKTVIEIVIVTHALKPKTQNNSHINNIYHNGNILKVNLLFQINYGDAFEFV